MTTASSSITVTKVSSWSMNPLATSSYTSWSSTRASGWVARASSTAAMTSPGSAPSVTVTRPAVTSCGPAKVFWAARLMM